MGGVNHNTLLKRTQHFIEKSIDVHGNSYDYSNVEYVNDYTKVIIVCETHGPFLMRPNLHSSAKQGCPVCAKTTKLSGIQRKHQACKEMYAARGRAIYGNKYDYTNMEYIGVKNPITMKCSVHGEFTIKYAGEHLYAGRECPQCTMIAKKAKLHNHNIRSTGEFVALANQSHNCKYSYEETIYEGYAKPITVTCPLHGNFTIKRGGDHICNMQGCQACNRKMSKNEQIIKNILEDLSVNFVYQKTFSDCKSTTSPKLLSFDFFLPDNGILIEFDGEQHATHVPFFHSKERFEQQQTHDKLKNEYAISNNYVLLRSTKRTAHIKKIIIDMIVAQGIKHEQ